MFWLAPFGYSFVVIPNFSDAIFSNLGYLLMFLGVVFSIIPVLPGALTVWAGALVYAWSHNFSDVGWPLLILLGAIALLSQASEFLITTMATRRAGATWKTVIGAMIGGIVGAIVLSLPVPIIGTLIGAALGAMIGVFLIEFLRRQMLEPALKTSVAYLAGCLVGRVIETSLCLIMIGIFVWWV